MTTGASGGAGASGSADSAAHGQPPVGTSASPAQQVAATLAAQNRHVPVEQIERDLSGLAGLDPPQAQELELLTYGMTTTGEPTPAFVPDRDSRQTLRWVLGQGLPAMVYIITAAVFALVPAIAVPLIIRIFVDRYLVAGDVQWGFPALVVLLGSAVLATVLVVLQFSATQRFAVKLSRTNYIGFSWHTLRMPIPSLQRLGAGVLIARSNAGQRLAIFGGMMLPLAMVNVVNALAFAVMLLVLSPLLGALAILVVIATAAVSMVVLRWRSRLQRDTDDTRSELFGATAGVLAAIESIKAAAWEQYAFARWSRVRSGYARAVSRLGVANQWMALIPAIAVSVALGTVLAVGSWMVVRGQITLGSLVASQSFTAMLLTSFSMLVYVGVVVQATVSASDQVNEVLAEPVDPEVIAEEVNPKAAETGVPNAAPTGVSTLAATTSRLRGDVELRGVSFGYDPDAPALIDNLDLRIAAGSRVALVGRSGSGKTTIAKFVVGELRPWAGQVLIDETPRLRLRREQLTSSVAYVPQQSVLFPGTIWDNLALWDPTITEEQLRRATADACIEETILARSGGLRATIHNQDSGFSGGEMQRLSLARALVVEPSVLILDEATSALDPVVEAQVDANIMRRGITCLIVAHRLSTVRDADEILVIDGGEVVQRGPYESIKDHGVFAELIHG